MAGMGGSAWKRHLASAGAASRGPPHSCVRRGAPHNEKFTIISQEELQPMVQERPKLVFDLECEILLEMYRRMLTIRYFEETVFEVYRKGWMPGLAHLSDGQEATPVGVCMALRQDDTI